MKSGLRQLDRDLLDGVMMCDTARVRDFLAQGADANVRDSEHQETPLMLAVKRRHGVGVVRLLLEAGAEVDARDDWGRTALFYAPALSEVFGVLLHAKADVHATDGEGNTILMRSVAASASLADVEELLRLGVDPRARNEEGETALDLAERLGLSKVAERLRSRAG